MLTIIEEINNRLGFQFRSEPIIKACNYLGSQNYKTLISTEVIIFVTYHWKSLSHHEQV